MTELTLRRDHMTGNVKIPPAEDQAAALQVVPVLDQMEEMRRLFLRMCERHEEPPR